MLKIENIGKNFGGVKAVDDLSFNIDKGEIVGLIGPNGSGKSTTINLICGVFPADSGNISVDNLNVSGLPTHERVASGISRTFQNIRLFKDLSVWQNVWVALQQDSNQSAGWIQEWFGNSKFQKEISLASYKYVTKNKMFILFNLCLLYTSPSPRDRG